MIVREICPAKENIHSVSKCHAPLRADDIIYCFKGELRLLNIDPKEMKASLLFIAWPLAKKRNIWIEQRRIMRRELGWRGCIAARQRDGVGTFSRRNLFFFMGKMNALGTDAGLH